MSALLDIDLYGYPVTVEDHDVGRYVFTECDQGKWKPELFDVFRRFLRPGMTYVDIGAYAGATTLWPALHGCQVYAFECDFVAYPVLMRNVELNPEAKKNIRIVSNACIAGHDGMTQFAAKGEWGSSVASMAYVGHSARSAVMPARTLSGIMQCVGKPKIDFLKVNVHGSEGAILKAEREMLERDKPVVHVYVHPDHFGDRRHEVGQLIQGLEPYRHLYTERGEPVEPADLKRDEWLEKRDYKVVAADGLWPEREVA